jgi:hypothetical protein
MPGGVRGNGGDPVTYSILQTMVRCRSDEIDAFRSTKNPTIAGRVKMSTVHLDTLRMVHEFQCIDIIESFKQ